MSACRTGCGESVEAWAPHGLCVPCYAGWLASPECNRAKMVPTPRDAVALVDFCTRARAERRPEVPREP